MSYTSINYYKTSKTIMKLNFKYRKRWYNSLDANIVYYKLGEKTTITTKWQKAKNQATRYFVNFAIVLILL